jgi:hypothetical protein
MVWVLALLDEAARESDRTKRRGSAAGRPSLSNFERGGRPKLLTDADIESRLEALASQPGTLDLREASPEQMDAALAAFAVRL